MTIPYGYCHCGCGQKTTIPTKSNAGKNRKRGVPMRFVHGHQRPRTTYTVDANGCWVWAGHLTFGYGYTTRVVDGVSRRLRAHRWMYEELVGPIPAGLQLDHLCRNRACVNPAHLEPVTSRENTLRGLRGYKLSHGQALEFHALRGDVSAHEVARRYGVSAPTIYSLWRGVTYPEAYQDFHTNRSDAPGQRRAA